MDAGCVDGDGVLIDEGIRFHPTLDDFCHSCLCANGTRQYCLSALCAQPTHCEKFEKVERTCCSYICSSGNDTVGGTGGSDALSTAGIRLAASTATCVLIVVLILLLMHKLRRHRLFLNIRQGIRGQGRGSDAAVVYSSAYDGVDIDISYEPLHIPGAPPPYTPTVEEAPPAYCSIADGSPPIMTVQNGVINTGCQTTPPESLYNISGEAQSKPPNVEAFVDVPTKPCGRMCKAKERTCGVGASYTDLSALTVDISDSCNDMREQTPKISAKPTPDIKPSGNATNKKGLPVRLEPIGAELPATKTPPTSQQINKYYTDRHNEKERQLSKSAGSSPVVLRRLTDNKRKVVLTEYGFIDDGSLSELLESDRKVIGLRDEQLLDIAAKKPDRLNARVRRNNRIKQHSRLSASTFADIPADAGSADTTPHSNAQEVATASADQAPTTAGVQTY